MGHLSGVGETTGRVGGQTSEQEGTTISNFGHNLADGEGRVPALSAADFRAVVLRHYREHGRDLPWRRTRDPYDILVSEIMLQQTQVSRVLPKYDSFLSLFPDPRTLAEAPLSAVLAAWQGLGYNRRALALHKAARTMTSQHGGRIPSSVTELRRLPGIGPATAAAVCVFAYGEPLVFIETNIRSAFLHHFFRECFSVPDADILPLIETTLDRENPRDWYYALMDYGAWVKRTQPNPSRRSKHHTKQSSFPGSRRQLRAQVLRLLLERNTANPPSAGSGVDMVTSLDLADIAALLPGWDPQEIQVVVGGLVREGFLVARTGRYRVA
jgi:A/G-specific adenine glycosylase